jgi:hypothetical protein
MARLFGVASSMRVQVQSHAAVPAVIHDSPRLRSAGLSHILAPDSIAATTLPMPKTHPPR